MLFVVDQFTGYWSVAWLGAPAAFLCKQTPCDYLTGWESEGYAGVSIAQGTQTWYFPFLKQHLEVERRRRGEEGNPEKSPVLKQTPGSCRNSHPGCGRRSFPRSDWHLLRIWAEEILWRDKSLEAKRCQLWLCSEAQLIKGGTMSVYKMK